jgi:histidinol phosphatase-like PHP family hydrolase
MKSIDTHVHFLVSKVAEPDWAEIGFAVRAARSDGIDIICVTEHLDAVNYEALVRGIFDEMRLGGTLIRPGVLQLDDGLILSSAAEIALKGGGDVGLHCSPQQLLALDRAKGAYSLADLVEHIAPFKDEVLLVAHHYFWANKSFAELPMLAQHVDAVELPAKDLAHTQDYVELAQRFDLPLIGASDAHTWVQIGSCRSHREVVSSGDFSHEELKRWVRGNELRAVPLEQAAERVRISRLLRDNLDARAASC